MSDLISRKAVLEMFAKYKFGAINNDMEREYIKETIPLLVNSIPTVEVIPKEKLDEILERLEEEKFWTASTYDEDGYCNDDSQEVVDLDRAIEIVKGVMNERDLERC